MNIDKIDLKFTSQEHYSSGGVDTMELLDSKLTTEMYLGLTIGDVIRYVTRYVTTRNPNDMEKALTMLAWGVNRLRNESRDE